MTYDLLLAGGFDRAALAAALADLAGVTVDAVDVADRDAEDRAWDSPVLCTYEPVAGDLSWLLDIYLGAGAAQQPEISVAAQLIAARLGTPVLWAAQEFPPSAYWLITPDGTRTRARVYDEENGDLAAYRLDAVEKPVPQLPSVRVERLPEVIREHRVPTPVTDELAAWLADENTVLRGDSHDAVRQALTYLAVWEQLIERIAAGWPPDGWYPTDFYRDDLTARDQLDAAVTRLPAAATGRFRWAIGHVDEKFKALTHPATTPPVPGGDAWWWQRVPDKPGLA
ncbi:hypothetical protein [Actinoplanes sp. NPDC051411]|uniref:hypothetical protein n=1 Tax=Actinoplanes sp. NPDC051411 TaxID=3155522 RepID=UPI003437FE12